MKIPVTKWRRAKNWGDYHMAVLLRKELENKGHRVLIQILPEWDDKKGDNYDVVIVFRGLSRYTVKPHQINMMWNISHPDDVSLDEYEDYDHVFIASEYWAGHISKQVSVPVESMLQCTDADRFYPPLEKIQKKYRRQLLFVGNSRNIYRKIIKDLLPTNHDLAIYGKCWGELIPPQFLKKKYIKNHHLYRYYGSTDILLNDHWDDMREKGFISNRIFDGLACGAFIVTDKVYAMGELEQFVQIYESKEELADLLEYYLNNPEERMIKSRQGLDYVIKNHTFSHRANQFSQVIEKLAI